MHKWQHYYVKIETSQDLSFKHIVAYSYALGMTYSHSSWNKCFLINRDQVNKMIVDLCLTELMKVKLIMICLNYPLKVLNCNVYLLVHHISQCPGNSYGYGYIATYKCVLIIWGLSLQNIKKNPFDYISSTSKLDHVYFITNIVIWIMHKISQYFWSL